MAVVVGSNIMLMPPTRAEEAAAVVVGCVRVCLARAVATREDEQAVSILKLGPFRPNWYEILQDGRTTSHTL
jgi:hypothetical protein